MPWPKPLPKLLHPSLCISSRGGGRWNERMHPTGTIWTIGTHPECQKSVPETPRSTKTSKWATSYDPNLGRSSASILCVYCQATEAKEMIDLAQEARFRRFRPAPAIMGTLASQPAEETLTQPLEICFGPFLRHWKYPVLHFALMFRDFNIIALSRISIFLPMTSASWNRENWRTSRWPILRPSAQIILCICR